MLSQKKPLSFRYLFRVLIGLLLVSFLCSCSTVHGAQKKDIQGFLWEVGSGKGRVLLLGSVHLLNADHYPLPAKLEKAYTSSDILVLEVDYQEANSPEMAGALMRMGMYTDQRTLKGTLSRETYKKLKTALAGLGYQLDFFNKFKPWFVNLSVSAMQMELLGYGPQYGLDYHLYMRAAGEDAKPVLGLETADQQIETLDALSSLNQEELLLQWLESFDTFEQDLKDLVTHWMAGNGEWLQENILDEFGKYPVLYKRMFTQRNQNWVPLIENYIKDDRNYLVVVGTGHLIGQDSVIEMLKGKGYRCKRL